MIESCVKEKPSPRAIHEEFPPTCRARTSRAYPPRRTSWDVSTQLLVAKAENSFVLPFDSDISSQAQLDLGHEEQSLGQEPPPNQLDAKTDRSAHDGVARDNQEAS